MRGPMINSARSPESILRSRGYGFRARRCAAPRNDRGMSPCTCIIVLARHIALRGLWLSPHKGEGAERRQALGCLRGTLRGPVTQARRRQRTPCVPSQTSSRSPRIRGTLASRRSTAAIYWHPAYLGKALERCKRGGALELHVAHSRVPLVVAEGCRRLPPGGTWLRASPQDAASRSDSGSSPETPSVNGTPRR
jgi:hypothetical protein